MDIEDDDDMWDEVEQLALAKAMNIRSVPKFVPKIKTKSIKIMIRKKLYRVNKLSGNKFESWVNMPNAKFTIIPGGPIQTEKDLCRFILLHFDSFGKDYQVNPPQYLVQTWYHSPFSADDFITKTKYTLEGKKRKKSKGFFTFWKGSIQGHRNKSGRVEGVFERYSGSMLGYLKASIPVGMKHLF